MTNLTPNDIIRERTFNYNLFAMLDGIFRKKKTTLTQELKRGLEMRELQHNGTIQISYPYEYQNEIYKLSNAVLIPRSWTPQKK